MCRICGKTPAQKELRFRPCCGACFSLHYLAEEDLQIQEESQAYLASIAEEQTWTGKEPALQGLLMPLDDSFELPCYSAGAEYLSPEHCRICFSTYGPQGLERHLQEAHSLRQRLDSCGRGALPSIARPFCFLELVSE